MLRYSILLFTGLWLLSGCVDVTTSTQKSSRKPTPTPAPTPPSPPESAGGLYQKYSASNFRNAPEFKQQTNPSQINYRVLHTAMHFMVNEARAKYGKPALPYNERLEVAAYFHSKRMAEQDFFSHKNPKSASRRSTSDRAKLAGIANPFIAENIVYTYTSSNPSYLDIGDAMMESWMNSSGHKSNILSNKGQAVGCGAYSSGKYWYGTQVFQWYKPVRNSDSPPKDHF